MGWTFHLGSTRKELIADLTKGSSWTRDDGKEVRHEYLKRCFVGNHMWTVLQVTVEGEPELTKTLVVLFLLSRGSGDGWGYKDISEDMGPCETSCPESYLDLCGPPLNDWSAQWREKVRAHHAARRERNRLQKERRKSGVNVGRVNGLRVTYIAI